MPNLHQELHRCHNLVCPDGMPFAVTHIWWRVLVCATETSLIFCCCIMLDTDAQNYIALISFLHCLHFRYWSTYTEPSMPLCSFGILVIKQPAPRWFLRGVFIYNFKARFKCLILKIKAKMTLLQFFGHIFLSYGPISKI